MLGDESENLRGIGSDFVGVVGCNGADDFRRGKLDIDWLTDRRFLLCDCVIGTTRMWA